MNIGKRIQMELLLFEKAIVLIEYKILDSLRNTAIASSFKKRYLELY